MFVALTPGRRCAECYGLHQERGPRKKAHEQHGDEIPGRPIAAVDLRQITLEMLVNEVEIEEFGVGPTRENVPRSCYQQKEQDPRWQVYGPEHAPFSEYDDPDPDDHSRDEDPD